MCSEVMDIAFLMDASGSVGHQNFDKEKQFITSVASTVNMDDGNVRVAVISYSTSAKVSNRSRNTCLIYIQGVLTRIVSNSV
jgi:hypothetical protein